VSPRPIHRRVVAPALALTAFVAGCGSENGSSGHAVGSEPARPANLGEVLHVRGDTVEVRMDEYFFAFAADTVPAGRIVLHIQNLGFEFHNLEFHQGDSIVYKMDNDMNPAQYRFVELNLEAGDYEVICTITGHDGKGMVQTLTVVPREDGG
jgi:plastocyanin